MEPNKSIRRVAIYGRVSTEHDAQLSAFENQQVWYEDEVQRHSDWLVVARFYDEGITGTADKKRPQFMKMIQQAREGRFDLIITREVCRFARNVVDTLSYVRELKSRGVEVYFISDNIWSFAEDGELRLAIFATLAQDESRKVSERAKAGQKISREKGVLYGNGNILGYERDKQLRTYVINEEQAVTVRKIFELYAQGHGYKKICNELTALGCKNAHGEVHWEVSNIQRIVTNATYKGYLAYNKSHSDGYLTQKRVNHKASEFQLVKGNFEPIISEELWEKCRKIREQKTMTLADGMGSTRVVPKKLEKTVWTKKLRCSCGSSFERYKWHVYKKTSQTLFGYGCYRQSRSISRKVIQRGLDPSMTCTSKSIPEWHLQLIAHKLFTLVFGDRKDAVLLACQMIAECYTKDTDSYQSFLDSMKKQIEKLLKRQNGLRSMCADGLISRDEFQKDNQAIEDEVKKLRAELIEIEKQADEKEKANDLNMEYIEKVLNSCAILI
jgi:DNA invertase Pin-like site-specific DNA recombinase